MFLAAHSRQASAGAWQAQTSLEAQPLSGDKALTRNLDADQLAALEVTNTGSQPLWLRLDSSGYPHLRLSLPATFCRLNDKYWGPMVSVNRCPRCVAANWCWSG